MSTPVVTEYQQPRTYGRIRLDEMASGELLAMIRRERSQLPKDQKVIRKILDRMESEVVRMRQECGWDGESQ